jgi:hypothetical protein
MLDPWIIEEIKRREQQNQERPVLELPIRGPEGRDHDRSRPTPKPEDETPRGVVIIDYAADHAVAHW